MTSSGDPAINQLPIFYENDRNQDYTTGGHDQLPNSEPTKGVAQKARTPPKISPPPLKRQRTDVAASFPPRRSPKLQPLRAAVPLNPASLARVRSEDDLSVSSGIARSDKSRTCRMCKKSSTKIYDPLILCTACQRPFHDSCRKPALAKEADPKQWQCFRCVRNAPKHHIMQARHVPSTSNVYIPDDSWEAAPTEQALATETTKDYLPRLKKMIFSPTILSHADHTTMRSIGENRLVPPGKDVLTEDSNDKSTLALLHNATPNRCKLSDTDPDPSSHTKILIRSPTKRPRLSRAISENELDRLVAISCESKAKLSTSELTPTLGKGVQRNEIPNTPTQGSSQLSTAVTSTHALSLSDAEAVTLSEANDTLVSLDQPGSRKSSALVTQLCTVCRKQRVLMKLGTKDAKCWSCRRPSLDPVPSTIPETPEGTSVQQKDTQNALGLSNQSRAIPLISKAVPVRQPVPWFESNLVGSSVRKKIVARTISIGHIPTFLQQSSEAPRKPISCVEDSGSSCQPPAENKHSVEAQMQPSIEGANKQPVNAAPLSGPGKVEGEGGKEPTVDDLLEESDVGEDGTSTPNGIPSSKTSVATTEPQVQTNDTSYPVDGDKYLSSCKTMPKVASHLANSRKLGQYAYRELIGIALLAANGTRWPTARIHDWIVKTFPGRYQKGIGRWESSLSAILSASPDFRGEKCPGSATRLEWTFTNATTRRRYATQFPEYCLSPAFTSQSTSPLRTPFQSRADAMEPTGPTHSLNSAARRSPSPGVLTRTPNTKEERMMEGPNGLSKDAQSVVCEKPSPTVETAREHVPVFVPYTKGASTRHVQNKDGDATGATSVFVPFDQQPRPTFAMEPGSGVRVETSFLNAFPEYAKPSIETMTQKQIDDKIAEIKKRPSRKHTFGQRLAFCRTHRKDVHNELEGVTRPKYTSRQKGDGGSDEDAEMHDMGSDEKDFEDIMDLPENSIPMIHEGQLAFRDGTLVNGKLPRSRVVHKVGRKYGI